MSISQSWKIKVYTADSADQYKPCFPQVCKRGGGTPLPDISQAKPGCGGAILGVDSPYAADSTDK